MTKKRMSRAMREALEDEADIRAYDSFKEKLAAGEAEMIPAEFANRIIDGENKIRVFREYRVMTAADLAAKAGISVDHLLQVEGGQCEGDIETIKKIAAALRLDADDLA